MMKSYLTSVLFLFFIQSGCSTETNHSIDQINYYQVETDKSFTEVIDDLIFAITERNFRLTGHLHIGKAIRDRKNPGFPDYEVLLYCNLTYAQKMLELDPEMINSCPGRISVRQKNNAIIITAPLLSEQVKNNELKSHLKKMNKLAREIVDYAADDWLLVYDHEPMAPD